MRLGARTWVDAPPWVVFRFLSSLQNQWSLTGGFVRSCLAGGLDAGGDATIVITGPARMRRVARVRIVGSSPCAFLIGRVELDSGTRAIVEWTITPVGHGAAVELTVTLGAVAWRERAPLAVGGRIWVVRRLQATVRRLRQQALIDAVGEGARPAERRAGELSA
ncbi:MAG: hypothetical protein ACXVY5_08390 [Gaiellales bacterium]